MKATLLMLCTALFLTQADRLKTNDLDALVGKQWKGTLTYLDYGSHKLVPIATELTVKNSAKGAGVYDWITVYPQETSHNNADELVISADGKVIDGEAVKKCARTDGILTIISEKEGSDDNKPAIFRLTYIIGAKTFSRKKEVCYKGEQKWFTRNQLVVAAE